MPKKTKRQKIAAQPHKHQINYHPIEHVSKPHENVTLTESVELKAPKKNPIFETSTVVFRSELKKSLIISVVLILLEVGIYIGQINGMSLNTILPF